MRRSFKKVIADMVFKTLCDSDDFHYMRNKLNKASADAKQAYSIANDAQGTADDADQTLQFDVLPVIDRIKLDWEELEKKKPGITQKVKDIWSRKAK